MPALTDPAGPVSSLPMTGSRSGWQSCEVTKRAVQPATSAEDVEDAVPVGALIARIAADQRAGRDTSKDVKVLVELAGRENRAALHRLAGRMNPGELGISEIECPDGWERVMLRGGSLDGEYFCSHRPRADVWIHSQNLEGTVRWKQRYRCVGHETVEDPVYGTLQVMSLQEFAAERGDSQG
jgi:hypothetical protein